MDPSVFFGRSRVTRQTLKPKQQSSDTDDVSCEVNVNNGKRVAKSGAKNQTGNTAAKDGTDKSSAAKNIGKKGAKKTVKDGRKKTPSKSTGKARTVHFEEEEDNINTQSASSGPVYLNVRRSDVVGDPLDEYEFTSVDENAAPPKKKPRKANASKKNAGWYGTVKWDPAKRPVLAKCTKPKPSTAKLVKKQAPGSEAKKSKESTVQKPKRAAQDNFDVPSASVSAASLQIQTGKQVTSMPISKSVRVPSKSLVPSTSMCPPQASSSPAVPMHQTDPFVSNKLVSDLRAKVDARLRNETPDTQVEPTLSPCVEAGLESVSTPVVTSKTPCHQAESTPVCVPVSVGSTTRNHERPTPTRTLTTFLPVRPICVRESPSFIEPDPVLEVPVTPSSFLPGTSHVNGSEAITSTPVTRSKSASNGPTLKSIPTVQFEAPSLSPSQVTCSPVPVCGSPGRPSNFQGNDDEDLSGLFDNIPKDRISVVPSRMFENHRGTIFVPDTERSKRKLPTLSPSKVQCGSRATTVKFVVPETSTGLDNCFGFDDEDLPLSTQVTIRARQVPATRAQAAKKQKVEKPNLSIQQVQAILRGELKLASPINATPRSVQTKLTDFVSSTPTSTPARTVQTSKAVLITPTPVPLFGEEEIDKDLPSPYVQLSRRSYDRLRPMKRIACGDEVLSDDEDEDDASNQKSTEAVAPPKKKNRSYKKKKKPEEAQLDVWANQIASHFEEVDEIELQVE